MTFQHSPITTKIETTSSAFTIHTGRVALDLDSAVANMRRDFKKTITMFFFVSNQERKRASYISWGSDCVLGTDQISFKMFINSDKLERLPKIKSQTTL